MTSHDDHAIRLWDARDSSTKGWWFEGHLGFVSKCKFSPVSENLFASACYDAKKNVFIWDVRCERPLFKLGSSESLKVFGLDWKEGSKVISGGESGKMNVYSFN